MSDLWHNLFLQGRRSDRSEHERFQRKPENLIKMKIYNNNLFRGMRNQSPRLIHISASRAFPGPVELYTRLGYNYKGYADMKL